MTASNKTRFCPSPTGLIHLGNARTALFNALGAISEQGTFLLRIEDTDQERSKVEYADGLMADLKWLGMDWQEGPGCEADAGPYWQSQRQGIYDKFYEDLKAQDLAYPCFCSEQQLALSRKLQRSQGKPPRYAGTCRNLSSAEIEARFTAGDKATLRFKVPQGQTITFHDLVRGKQRFTSDDIGDFIIRRTNGTAPFMYSNAIDDALMGVTIALRGEDHLTNTPRQVMLLDALGLPAPTYGHISLILGQDGAPLSKRNGSRSIQDLRNDGFLPLAVINYLARLGHYYADDVLMDFNGLGLKFAYTNLGKSPAKFDPKQLLRWQKAVVQTISEPEFYTWVGDEIKNTIPENKLELFYNTIRHNIVFPEDVRTWVNAFFVDSLALNGHEAILKETGSAFFDLAAQTIKSQGTDYNKLTATLKEQLNVKGKKLFMPLRIALTGKTYGPELANIITLLGQAECIARFEKAKQD